MWGLKTKDSDEPRLHEYVPEYDAPTRCLRCSVFSFRTVQSGVLQYWSHILVSLSWQPSPMRCHISLIPKKAEWGTGSESQKRSGTRCERKAEREIKRQNRSFVLASPEWLCDWSWTASGCNCTWAGSWRLTTAGIWAPTFHVNTVCLPYNHYKSSPCTLTRCLLLGTSNAGSYDMMTTAGTARGKSMSILFQKKKPWLYSCN